jgi:hypothetical protein
MFRALYLSGVFCTYDQQILNLMNTSCVSATQDSLQILVKFFDFIRETRVHTIPVTVGQNPMLDCSAVAGIRGKCKLIIIYPL